LANPLARYRVDMGLTVVEYSLMVDVMVQLADLRAAQVEIFDYYDLTGTKSIHACVEADDKLGATVEWTDVAEGQAPQAVTIGTDTLLMARFPVTVSVR
jgi:hypothetical protein